MKLISRLVKDLPASLYRQVCSLNLRDSGYAQGHLRKARAAAHQYTRVITATQGPRLLGWGLMMQCMRDGQLVEYSINFYVRRNLRGTGIGGMLYGAVCKTLHQLKARGHVCVWSDESNRFYRRYRCVRIKVKVSPRYSPL